MPDIRSVVLQVLGVQFAYCTTVSQKLQVKTANGMHSWFTVYSLLQALTLVLVQQYYSKFYYLLHWIAPYTIFIPCTRTIVPGSEYKYEPDLLAADHSLFLHLNF